MRGVEHQTGVHTGCGVVIDHNIIHKTGVGVVSKTRRPGPAPRILTNRNEVFMFLVFVLFINLIFVEALIIIEFVTNTFVVFAIVLQIFFATIIAETIFGIVDLFELETSCDSGVRNSMPWMYFLNESIQRGRSLAIDRTARQLVHRAIN